MAFAVMGELRAACECKAIAWSECCVQWILDILLPLLLLQLADQLPGEQPLLFSGFGVKRHETKAFVSLLSTYSARTLAVKNLTHF